MDTKERITSESLKLFMRYGIRSVTMDTIAENLGISKRTIYELFSTKDELIKACFNHISAEDEKQYQEILKNSGNVIEAFLHSIRRSVELMKSISPLFFHDIKKYYPEIFNCTGEEHSKRGYDRIIHFIKKGKEEGYLRKDINEDITTKLIMEQFNIMGNEELFPPDKYNRSKLLENIAVNFVRGIATEEGLKIINNFNEQFNN
ncbi:MAG TPA: TetR/AcrR family transcriptional regulator [Bacteroidetes bacterium]|nr:TetR/AcrR family transcriptional regulator [Bacteroidota bacterium]